MRYELERHKNSDKVKWIFTGVGFLLVFVMLTGLCLQLFGQGKVKPSEWFKKVECVHEYGEDGKCTKCGELQPEDGGGLEVPSVNENGISLMSKKLSREVYAENDITPAAVEAYEVVATAYDEDGNSPDYLQSFTYTLAWSGSSSLDITEYMTLTQEGAMARLTLLQLFSSAMELRCKSNISEKSAKVTIMCRKRIVGVKVTQTDGSQVEVKDNSGQVLNFELPDMTVALTDSAFKSKFIFSAFSIDGIGRMSSSLNECVLEIIPTEAFKTVCGDLLIEKASWIRTRTSGGLSSTKITEFMTYFFGADSTTDETVRAQVYSALSKCVNQFTVTYHLTSKAGQVTNEDGTKTDLTETVTVSYIANINVNFAEVAQITFNQSSLLF